jgi:hypothetical protein
VTESQAFKEDLAAESARLPYLRHVVEERLYPRMQSNPQQGWYGRHQKRWYTRLKVVDPLLTIQVSYSVDLENQIVRMESLDVVPVDERA